MSWVYYDPRRMVVKRKKRYYVKFNYKLTWNNRPYDTGYMEGPWYIQGIVKKFTIEVVWRHKIRHADACAVWNIMDLYTGFHIGCAHGHGIRFEGKAEPGTIFILHIYPPENTIWHCFGRYDFDKGFVEIWELNHDLRATREPNPDYPARIDFNKWTARRFVGSPIDVFLIRVYIGKCLTDSEVLHNYNNIFNPIKENLVQWLMFEEGKGNKVYDLSGYGHHAELSGNYEWVRLP